MANPVLISGRAREDYRAAQRVGRARTKARIQLKIRLLSRPNISSISYNLVAFVSPLLTCLGCIYLNIFQKIGHTIRHRDLYVIICYAGKPFVDPLRFIVSERISHGIRKGLLMKYVFTLQCVSGKGQRCNVGI